MHDVHDSIDDAIAAWSRQRPDLDFAPVEIIGRIQKLAALYNRQIQQFATTHGLDQSELDVLMTLRRAGHPYALSPTKLLQAALVTSGAITNRIDRLEAKGLVRRSREGPDRRSLQVRLTDAGLTTVDHLIELHLANERRFLGGQLNSPDRLTSDLRALLLKAEQTAEPLPDQAQAEPAAADPVNGQ